MTNNQFYKRYFQVRVSKTTEAARLVLVEKMGIRAAARLMGIDKGSVSRMVNKLRRG